MTKQDFTAIAVIIDASGSMGHLQHDTIGSFNQFLTDQKVAPGEAAFSLCTFNTDYRLVHDFIPLAGAPNLDAKTYRPSGGTALLDAMGTTIDSLGTKLAAMTEENRPSKVIVLVITDGEENYSHRFSLEQIKEKVSHQHDVYGWEFLFFGANIDAISAGASLGVAAQNTISYSSTTRGTSRLYATASASVSSYRAGGTLTIVNDLTDDTIAGSSGVAVISPVGASVGITGTAKPTVFDPGHSLPTKK
jgi:uncharacterized protein YegL